jgi:hypothetical protein
MPTANSYLARSGQARTYQIILDSLNKNDYLLDHELGCILTKSSFSNTDYGVVRPASNA